MAKESSSSARRMYEEHLGIINTALRQVGAKEFPSPADVDLPTFAFRQKMDEYLTQVEEKDNRIVWYAALVEDLLGQLAKRSGKSKATISADMKRRGSLGLNIQQLEATAVAAQVKSLWNRAADLDVPEHRRAKFICEELKQHVFKFPDPKTGIPGGGRQVSMKRSIESVRIIINNLGLRSS